MIMTDELRTNIVNGMKNYIRQNNIEASVKGISEDNFLIIESKYYTFNICVSDNYKEIRNNTYIDITIQDISISDVIGSIFLDVIDDKVSRYDYCVDMEDMFGKFLCLLFDNIEHIKGQTNG